MKKVVGEAGGKDRPRAGQGGGEAAAGISHRKRSHVDICLREKVSGFVPSGFGRLRLRHNALPEIDLAKVETATTFLGRDLKLPFVISSMTGGYEQGGVITRNLARAAQETGVAMGVGSQRIALEEGSAVGAFRVRDAAPDVLLFANLGAVQLNYGYGIEEYRRAVEMIGADGLFLHLNPVQEAIQPEGDTNYEGLLAKIGELVKKLGVPVIVKEVGMGISGTAARRLRDVGVEYVDVAGQGGTSWAFIEGRRGPKRLGEAFAGWGIPTLEALEECLQVKGLTVLASGGIRNGVEGAKALALGAKLVGLALPFLEAGTRSVEAVVAVIRQLEVELRTAMFGVGAASLNDLDATVVERVDGAGPGVCRVVR